MKPTGSALYATERPEHQGTDRAIPFPAGLRRRAVPGLALENFQCQEPVIAGSDIARLPGKRAALQISPQD